MTKIYLAGPTVFLPNALDVFAEMKAALSAIGVTALSPFDNEPPAGSEGPQRAIAIRRGNISLLDEAGAVIADISSFRGPDMDPGTAWEIGYATCRGIPVEVYSNDPRPYIQRVNKGTPRDYSGLSVEDFGLQQNLMICGIEDQKVWPDYFAAAERAAYLAALPGYQRFTPSPNP